MFEKRALAVYLSFILRRTASLHQTALCCTIYIDSWLYYSRLNGINSIRKTSKAYDEQHPRRKR